LHRGDRNIRRAERGIEASFTNLCIDLPYATDFLIRFLREKYFLIFARA
jgi:hypothetical protein